MERIKEQQEGENEQAPSDEEYSMWKNLIGFREMVRGRQEGFSETLTINESGTFDGSREEDEYSPFIEVETDWSVSGHTPEDLYALAQKIEKGDSRFHFSFEKDPQGKWLKYTVTREA